MTGLTLYSMPSSGNSYKVRLLLALTGQAYTHIPCEDDSPATAQAKASGALPLGKLPALHLPTGEILSESGAILWYLGQGTGFLPTDPRMQSQMLSWMFFEQNRLEPVIAVRAALRTYPRKAALATPERMADLLEQGHDLLQIVEDHLTQADWLAGDSASLADIALYGYVHSSGPRGGYDMARFPAIARWCAAITALPGYTPLKDSA